MRLSVFRSGKGDCLLLTAEDGATMLVDGGMSNAYRDHVRPSIGLLAEAGRELDLVYVSHIDEDHIAGVLTLLEDSVAWRRFDYQFADGNSRSPQPKFPRPPKIKAMWHNAFKRQVQDNKGAIEDQLVANARLTNTGLARREDSSKSVSEVAFKYRNYATSVKQGLQLSLRAARQLKIPINPISDGRLIFVERAEDGIPLGSMEIFVVGPFQADLEKLRKEWNKWLRNNRKIAREIEKEIEEEIKEMKRRFPKWNEEGLEEGQRLSSTLREFALALGNRSDVSPPNLASLMLLVEENNKRLLLTGDGFAGDLIKGLERRGKLDQDKRLHVDVLKIQHHGSKNNFTPEFLSNITADHYIFCGNGDHHNPHLEMIEDLIKARHSLPVDHTQKTKPFKLWFNSSEKVVSTQKRKDHMRAVREQVVSLASGNNQFSFKFLTRGSKFELKI